MKAKLLCTSKNAVVILAFLTCSTNSVFAQGPVNDFCGNPASLPVYGASCGATTSGNVANATQSLAPIACGTTSATANDVWYKFVASSTSQTITVVGSTNFDAVVDLRTGSCTGTNMNCADATASGGTEVINVTGLTLGTTYYVRVYHWGSNVPQTTTFTICITTPPPANDDCAGAVSLTVYGASCGTTTTGNVASATQSIAAAPCAGTADDDVWYKFVATSTSHTITVVGSANFDAVVNVRSGSCSGTSVFCADGSGNAGTEVINATNLTVGSTYYVRAYHYWNTVPSTTTFTICITTPTPANDNCSGAIALTVYGATCGGATTGNDAGATQSLAATCAGTADDDVWYKFIATSASHTITVVGTASFDAVVDLRSGACNGSNLSCADVTANGGTEVINATGLTVGTTYYIRVYHYSSASPLTTTFTICITTPAPANDDCANAAALTVYGTTCGGAVTGNVSGATQSIAAAPCAGTADDDIWYKFVATSTSHIITVVGSASFDAVIDLRSGACNGTNMNCADANGSGGTEVITATGLVAGTTYYVRVYHYFSSVPSTTTFTICITTPAPANDNCSGAASLTVYGATCGGATTGDVAGATQSLTATCVGTANDDVWYSFVATSTSQTITVTGSTNFDAVIDLRSGVCNGTNISCKDTSFAAGTEILKATGLTVGNTYYVRVYDYYSTVPATTTFTICITTPTPPAPANDNCSGATSLTVYGVTCGGAVTGNVTGATASTTLAIPCNNFTSSTANDVWYSFTATSTSHIITVVGSTSFDAVVDLRSTVAGACSGTNVSCADATTSAGTEVITATGLTAGNIYFVRVYHYGSAVPATTTFTICITTPAPTNDNCSGATSLTVYGAACGATTTGNVVSATQSIAAITCNGSTGTANDDVWYSFTATATAHNITVIGSASFDAVVDLRSGACNGTNINCADSTFNGGTEIIRATGLTVGTTYYVRVYHYGSAVPATTIFTICVTTPVPPAPANDNCSGATSLTVYGATCGGVTTGTVAGATQSMAPISCNNFTSTAANDVWYSFVATSTSHIITVVGSTSFDAVVDLRSGPNCSGTNINCHDTSFAGGTEILKANGLTLGSTYFVRVYHYGSSVPATTTFTICITTPTPANDDCAGAVSLTVFGATCGGATTGNVASATQSIAAAPCAGTANDDVWYSFVATSTSHTITVVGSTSFDAVIDLRSGSCNGTNVSCKDTSGTNGTEILKANGLTVGNTYYVRVYHYYTAIPATTTFTICITTPAPPAPANDDCAGATSLQVYGASCGGATTGNVASATQSIVATPCTGTANDDVWYKFVATATAHNVTVVGSANFDAVVDLRSGACTGTNVSCADATFSAGTEVIIATGLTIGNTYFVRVFDFYSNVPATTTFTICVTTPTVPPPANNDCANATVLTPNSTPTCTNTPVQGTVAGATQSITAITCNGSTGTANDDVWYKFTATSTTHDVTVVGSASLNAVVDMRSGSCSGPNVGCADATGNGGTEVINATGLTVGNIYWVRVYDFGSGYPATSTFTICVTTPGTTPPANNDCSGAVSLTVYGTTCGGSTTGNTANATPSIAAAPCTGTADDDVWYSFTATASAHDITVVGSNSFNAVIDLRSGACTGTNVSCKDATLAGGTEVINATGLTVGTTYFVRVYDFGSTAPATTTFTICVTTPGSNAPANDNCGGATSLIVYGATCGGATTGNVAGATQSLPAITCSTYTGTANDDVWYSFLATSTSHIITVVGATGFDAVVDLRSGACSGTNINCADTSFSGGTEILNANGLTVGNTYFVRVYHYSSSIPANTTFTICVTTPTPPVPANNDCAGATSLTVYGAACGGATTGNTASATNSIPAITCNSLSGTADDDVWYKFVATATAHDITVVGSTNFNAVVDLRSGVCPTGTNVNCADAATAGGTEVINATGLTIGNTYFVRVYDFGSTTPATTSFTICVTTPSNNVPANDNCSGATSLTVYGAACGGAVTGDVAGATQSVAPITCNGLTGTAANDVWYSFTATGTVHNITVIGSASFDAVVDLRSGACPAGTNVNCSNTTLTAGTEVINATGLTVGTTYFVRVYHYGSNAPSTTSFTICVTTPSGNAPANDDCSGATSLTVYGVTCGGATTGNVTGATQSLAAITCGGSNGTAEDDVWYSFVATGAAHIVTVAGSASFNAVIDLRSGVCPGTNTNCADATTNGGTEVLNASGLTVGNTYWVRVYDFGSTAPASTTFTICVTTPGPPPTAPANDSCAGAFSLQVYGTTCGGSITGDVAGATQSLPAITCAGSTGTANDDVWYSFTATAVSHKVTVIGSASFDAVIDLRSGTCATGININCADTSYSGDTEILYATGLTVGSIYFVRVYHWSSSIPATTTFSICVTTPCVAPNTTVSPAAATICSGGLTTLTASGAITYAWSPTTGLSSASGTTVTANPGSTTTYTVTGTSNGCSGTQSVTVTVNPPATSTVTQLQDVLTSTPAVTYQWQLDGVPITGANSQNYLVTQNGNYTVVTTDAWGCTALSPPFPIIKFVGINKIDGASIISIYPNPFSTSATIAIKGFIGSAEVGIRIYDMLGREVKNVILLPKSQNSNNQSGMEFIIERNDLTNGMYFYKITTKNEIIGSGKFSIQ